MPPLPKLEKLLFLWKFFGTLHETSNFDLDTNVQGFATAHISCKNSKIENSVGKNLQIRFI